jgi:hypothetical protein
VSRYLADINSARLPEVDLQAKLQVVRSRPGLARDMRAMHAAFSGYVELLGRILESMSKLTALGGRFLPNMQPCKHV